MFESVAAGPEDKCLELREWFEAEDCRETLEGVRESQLSGPSKKIKVWRVIEAAGPGDCSLELREED